MNTKPGVQTPQITHLREQKIQSNASIMMGIMPPNDFHTFIPREGGDGVGKGQRNNTGAFHEMR